LKSESSQNNFRTQRAAQKPTAAPEIFVEAADFSDPGMLGGCNRSQELPSHRIPEAYSTNSAHECVTGAVNPCSNEVMWGGINLQCSDFSRPEDPPGFNLIIDQQIQAITVEHHRDSCPSARSHCRSRGHSSPATAVLFGHTVPNMDTPRELVAVARADKREREWRGLPFH
jgi:hypothetical protein